ncbi:hypothetical protein [Nocardiopsis synnemataformans]|uniref:hypothetical protein n=1 Tax=Nocardiopsis synnemataformans TaxID=61305 RepID=UPI003EBB0439
MTEQITTTATAAADAQHGLDHVGLEAALCATGDHLNAVAAHYGDHPLTGRQIGALLAALSLGIRAYQQHADPVAARWDRIVTRDEDGTTWVLCTTDPGQPVALALDEEHAEALAGSLLGTEDGEEVAAAEDHASLRDRIAQALADHETDPDDVDLAGHRSCSCGEWNSALGGTPGQHRTDAVMDDVAPALAARDRRIAELEEESARDDQIIRELNEQLAAATNPGRAARQLDADAHPTTERSGQ